jgi:glycosyltransferase involved in cell wall biosynthesis
MAAVRHSDDTAVLRGLFVNENVGGHAALHRALRAALAERGDVDATLLDVPPAGVLRRLAGAPFPGLGRLDADLQPLRYTLAQSAWVRRRVGAPGLPREVLHVYSHNAALLLGRELAAGPSVVSTDCTNEQNARTLPYRRPTQWTERALRLTRRFEDRVYERATLLVAQSEYAADSLRADYGVPDEKLRLVRFGILLSTPEPREATSLPEVTFVGSSLERKGGRRLLDLHRRRLRDRCVLNLVTHDPLLPEPNVRVHGDVRPGDGKIERILARTAVFAFPSEIDKSSYAVLEAMAQRVPVVAVRQGGIPEQVEDGVSGLLVPPGDDVALAAALERLLDDAEARDAYGKAARERAERLFDARRTTAELVAVLREAVARAATR